MPSTSDALAAPEPTTPLAGIRVVDLSTTLPGAFCKQFLADRGAEGLMLEAPLRFSSLVGPSRSEIRAPGGRLAVRHTVAVLRVFGYDDATIAKWQDAGVIHCG
ncbi:CoA transferase [Mycobacterium sp. E3247]|uniref:CoA transferase n=1 Tax=Mycobacterium sp. E3247 TaxID=1856864 RepID=UPI0007FDAE24|nr:CoA transferase [Mycobacterium sp. E3247]OBH09081.1 hypothetical protein A9X04_22265 [Mycobacterium sp. E3247]